jgi:hypothetical protein
MRKEDSLQELENSEKEVMSMKMMRQNRQEKCHSTYLINPPNFFRIQNYIKICHAIDNIKKM